MSKSYAIASKSYAIAGESYAVAINSHAMSKSYFNFARCELTCPICGYSVAAY
jgi:hypothetical protein